MMSAKNYKNTFRFVKVYVRNVFLFSGARHSSSTLLGYRVVSIDLF